MEYNSETNKEIRERPGVHKIMMLVLVGSGDAAQPEDDIMFKNNILLLMLKAELRQPNSKQQRQRFCLCYIKRFSTELLGIETTQNSWINVSEWWKIGQTWNWSAILTSLNTEDIMSAASLPWTWHFLRWGWRGMQDWWHEWSITTAEQQFKTYIALTSTTQQSERTRGEDSSRAGLSSSYNANRSRPLKQLCNLRQLIRLSHPKTWWRKPQIHLQARLRHWRARRVFNLGGVNKNRVRRHLAQRHPRQHRERSESWHL